MPENYRLRRVRPGRSAAHACKGQSLATKSAGDFVYVPLGTCEKLTGGKLSG